jgi:hypothetical protein
MTIDGYCIEWLDLLPPYTQYSGLQAINSAVADLHTLQFTVVHEIGLSVFTSRNLATDLKNAASQCFEGGQPCRKIEVCI